MSSETPAQATCEFCGEPCPEGQYHPTWHDEGAPMRSCDACLPDTPARCGDPDETEGMGPCVLPEGHDGMHFNEHSEGWSGHPIPGVAFARGGRP